MIEPSPAPAARAPRPRRQEELLIELRGALKGERILCTSAGYAQLAATLAAERPGAQVRCLFLDAHLAEEARRHAPSPPPANLAIECAADFPELEADLVLLPLSASGEAELGRELLQAGHERLRAGGVLAASTENRDDRWLNDRMRRLFAAVTRRPGPLGTAYIARKTAPLKRRVDFARSFAFRDGERLLEVVSRPGVFSHGRVDPGARALLERMEVRRGDRVLDVGCGSGVLSLAAAARGAAAVLAVDSNARAVACTAEGARRNGLAQVAVELNAAGRYGPAGSYDLALANPPYFADFRIARLFVEGARDALRPGGRLLVVTKMPDWYRENPPAGLEPLGAADIKGYSLIQFGRL